MMKNKKPHIVIIGGGFGGLNAAILLGQAKFSVTLIDKENFHLFQPLLYQVAAGFLTPSDIASPLRTRLARYKTVNVIQDKIVNIDSKSKLVYGIYDNYSYDKLIVASGSSTSYFGFDNWSKYTTGLKTINDSLRLRSKILKAFEAAERAKTNAERKSLLTFVIIGAGPTGVELAGAFAELARQTLKDEFRNFDPLDCKIVLLEGGNRILPSFHEKISIYAQKILYKMRVEVFTETMVTNITENKIEAISNNKGNNKKNTLEASNIIWAAGVKASDLANVLKNSTLAELDKTGRVKVEKNLTIKGYQDIFVIGDMAYFEGPDQKSLPGVAPVAMQQGRYVARAIIRQVTNKKISPFVYFDKGNMAVIGKGRAVAEAGWLKLTGFVAWLAWAFIHIYFLIGFENKFVVFFRWALNYITNNRGPRLITR